MVEDDRVTQTDNVGSSTESRPEPGPGVLEPAAAQDEPVAADGGGPSVGGRRRRRVWDALLTPSFAAVAVWLVGVPLVVLGVHIVNANPLTSRGAVLPPAVGLFLVVVVVVAAVRVHTPILAGLAAGAAAVWVELCILSGYHGTPFGDSGLRGDAARFTAMVTRYTVTLLPVDAFVPSVPTEYPPLFPWLIARAADVVHRPGWSLVGHAQALLMSLTVLAGFLLWQRIIPAWPALLLAMAAPVAFGQPRKVYEIFTMAILVPCALAALCRFRRPGGLHWLPAGLVLGVILQVYQGYVLFTAAGLLALAVMGWRDARRRGQDRAFLLHLAGIVGTAVVVAAWYLVPFVHALLTIGGPRVNDYYVAGEITSDPLAVHRLIEGSLAPLTIIGLVGLLAFRRRRWWAAPLLALLAGAYLYRMVFLLVFVATGHTGYLDYTGRIISMLLIIGGILTAWTAAPIIAARLRRPFPPGIGIASAAGFGILAMATVWQVSTPSPIGSSDRAAHPTPGEPNLAAYAHVEPLPNGTLPQYHQPKLRITWFPTGPIEAAVDRRLGPGARPLTLSANEKLFAFLPWPAYVAVERQASNTFTHWDDRVAQLRALSQLTDPAAFAAASASTRYGAIQVFVLNEYRSYWGWGPLKFDPHLFSPAHWWIERLPSNTVVAIRR